MDDHARTPTILEAPRPGRRPRRRGWTVAKFAVLVACAGGLFGLLAQAVEQSREAARRSQCTCNLCQIKLALHNYHSANGSFPPAYVVDAAGKPLYSWRVLILPFMEYSTLYNAFNLDEPWDSPTNIPLLAHMPPNFACPSRLDVRTRPTTLTSYVAITGPGTMFPGAGSTKIDDITDGTANTLMLAEVADVDIPWTAPVDLDVRTMSFRVNDPTRPSISSRHPGGANIVLGDASTLFMRNSISQRDLKALITIAGGEAIDARKILAGE